MPSPSLIAASSGKPPGTRLQRGFTLVEVALVLILVSMVLSGTMHGAELINSTHVRGLAADFQDVRKDLTLYQDRYRSQPGDDATATSHLGATTQSGNGNGVVDGNWYDSDGGSEASRIWQHFRMAGLISGTANGHAGEYAALNSLGHPMGLQSGSSDPARSPIKSALGTGMSASHVMCSRGIPGKLALALDIRLDDGNPAAGAMLATPDTGAAYSLGATAATLPTGGPTDLQHERFYIVCMAL